VKLQEHLPEFEETGLKVIAITYDAPEKQQPFIDRFDIQYPILSDIEATTVKNLGILNTQYSEGDRAYGIPYPGIYVLDTNKKIVGKIFIEGYKQRMTTSSVLQYAKKVLGSH
jgi:peroxiredoxin